MSLDDDLQRVAGRLASPPPGQDLEHGFEITWQPPLDEERVVAYEREWGIEHPNYQIDVTAEQAKLVKADVIVWQFPVNWYSLPALLKKWLDNVFSHGFAYGDNKRTRETSLF